MSLLEDRLETVGELDRFHTYCLWEYQPVTPPVGKWPAANLLYHTFEFTGAGPGAYQAVDAIRRAIGISNTVWGVKQLGDRIAWEYYFYDYDRLQRQRSAPAVLAALAPQFSSRLQVPETLPYFMFSLDFAPEDFQRACSIDLLHLYIGNVGSQVSSGMNYALTETSRTLENFYFFFDARRQLDEVAIKVASSAFIEDPRLPLTDIIWPELAVCDTICIANKSDHDCIYFAGVKIDQFIFFLQRLRYPQPIIAFVKQNRARLDHLLFDVGFDYVHRKQGGLQILKSGYYGTF